MKFHSSRRSTVRFAVLVGCISITLGLVIATPIVTDVATAGGIWTEIVRIFSPRPPNRTAAGGKGANNVISPGVWFDRDAKPGSIGEVWNVRPVILYESSENALTDPVRIELMQDESIVQSFDIKDRPSHKQLPINPELKPGEEYKIRQFLSASSGPTNDGTKFVVMPYGPKRELITTALAKLDCEFAKDEAKRSTARIRVFVEAGLWSDALQEASALAKNDQEWAMLKGTIEQWKKSERK
jgi:hypothetical protein